jgi:hypothetical protein
LHGFSSTEWNALANRASASLNALRSCAGADDGRCHLCRTAAKPAMGHGAGAGTGLSCRYRFRRAQQQLCELARSAPTAQKHQLCRTVATLELAYRQIRSGEGGNDLV